MPVAPAVQTLWDMSSPALRPAFLSLAILLASSGCAAPPEDDDAVESGEHEVRSEDVLDAQTLAELRAAGFAPDEIGAVARSVVISERLAVQSYVSEANAGEAHGTSVRRESHGKSQGCLRARFDVTTDANVGVFRQGASYPAWVRLSNGGAYQKDDKSTHISRGWGIKLLGTPGTATGTHDFLFITSPRFFIHDIRHYPSFLESSGNGRLGFFWNLLTKMSWEEKTVIFHRIRLKVRNLLESPEYSAVPYAFGDAPVKYAVAPCDAGAPPTMPGSLDPPRAAGEDYLEEAMDATLRSADPDAGVCYAFYVQKQRTERTDPIENPTRAWEGAFERVATVTFPYGQHRGGPADYRQNEETCEQMAFDPWNTTEDSVPLGKTNWTRKAVYAALAHFRRVELPALYAMWMQDPDDARVREDIRRELSRLRDPAALRPTVQDTREPDVDDGFRDLGIVR
jgi:hypothetical protein